MINKHYHVVFTFDSGDEAHEFRDLVQIAYSKTKRGKISICDRVE